MVYSVLMVSDVPAWLQVIRTPATSRAQVSPVTAGVTEKACVTVDFMPSENCTERFTFALGLMFVALAAGEVPVTVGGLVSGGAPVVKTTVPAPASGLPARSRPSMPSV